MTSNESTEQNDSNVNVANINSQSLINDVPNSNDTIIEPPVVLCGKDLNLTKSQLITIILLALFFFFDSTFSSIFAPFFPGVATDKNLSQTQIGIIFGVFQFVLLIFSLIFGKYLDYIGVRFLFLGGTFLASTAQILFGFLNRCPDGNSFFIISIADRAVCGLGSSMGLSFAIVGYYFPNRVGSIVALLETLIGLGLMIGPVLGGFLFQIGGYPLPFFAIGGLLFVVFLVSLCVFPAPTSAPYDPNREASFQITPLLKIAQFNLALMMLFMGSFSITFIEPLIQLHLKKFDLTSVELGLIFFIPSFLYVIATPIMGYVCDKFPKYLPLFMIISAAISAIAFSLIGPIPFFNLPLNLYIFVGAFFLFGFSFGGLIIPVYSQLMIIAGKAGYPIADLRTQGIISGVFSSVWSFGAMIGPIFGGSIVDVIGFDYATFIIVVMFLVTGFVYAACYACTVKSSINRVIEESNNIQTESETQPLLNNA